jgi:hypothetical protein
MTPYNASRLRAGRERALEVTPQSIIEAAQAIADREVEAPADTLGVADLLIDVSTADANRQILRSSQRVYGLVFSRNGSTPGVVLEVKTSAGTLTFRPGDRLKVKLDELVIYRAAGSLSSGTALLRVLQHEAAEFTEDTTGAGVDGGRVQYSAAHNVTTNTPALPTDGVPIANGNGLRAIISAGSNITALLVVWWVYDELAGGWAETETQSSPPTGRTFSATADQLVGARVGRAFAEVRSSTNAGVGPFTVTLVAN